jgi:isopentenyl-diphosphate Delta-isomerase
MNDQIQSRKADHLRMASESEVGSRRTAGFMDVHLVHTALPEVNLDEIDTSVVLLGHRLELPLVIAAMTGGHAEGGRVNAILARAAERFGIAMGVGSQRAAVVDPSVGHTYAVTRENAPTAFLIANIGATQLVAQGGTAPIDQQQISELVRAIGADALGVHMNPLQELVQTEGERDARGHLAAIARLTEGVDLPVIAKETGGGVSETVARQLAAAGVKAIDVGGVGGTSFAAIEALRATERGDERGARLGALLRDWGIPTVTSIALAARTGVPVIATGGIRSGLDAAKAIAMGATAVGVARPLLQATFAGDEAVAAWIERFADELRATMFLTGAQTVAALSRHPRIIVGETAEWLRQLDELIPGTQPQEGEG